MSAIEIRHSSWIDLPDVAMPPGQLLAAIGDVHGMAGQAEALAEALRRDFADADGGACVWLGDFVDRGPYSAAVIDIARQSITGPRSETISLLGNHEALLLGCIDAHPAAKTGEAVAVWLSNGGGATLDSLGLPRRLARDRDLPAHLNDALGAERLAFLRSLPRSTRFGDLLFAHAGIDPALPLPAQDPDALMWIREPFLAHAEAMPEGVVVVHGHTIEEPAIRRGNAAWRGDGRPTRIGIDGGCFMSGILTALECRDGQARLVHAIGEPAF